MGPKTAQKDLGFSVEGLDWNDYIALRPAYPPSFFFRIYNHHSTARPSNTFTTAHDAGAGAGIVSETLAAKFNHVIVSEPNIRYLKIAEQRLSSLSKPFPKDKFSYLAEGAENCSVPDGTVDCVTICEAIHWTDAPAAIAEAARQLKSGGTFCCNFYIYPRILGNENAQDVWHGMFSTWVKGKLAGDPSNLIFSRASKYVATGLDCFEFDEAVWEEGVERCFTNCDGKRSWTRFGEPTEFEEGRVGKSDRRTFMEGDRAWMTEGCNLAWLRKAAVTFLPILTLEESWWVKLEEGLGGKEEKVTVSWPNVQIIGTRK